MNQVQSIGAIAAQFGGMAAVVAFIWILGATRSLHPIRFLVWRLVYGQEAPSDPKIAEYAAQQASLMNFRHFSGVDAESLAEAHGFIAWSAALGMPLRNICSAMKYVDVRKLSVNADAFAKFRRRPWRIAISSSYVCLVLAGGLASCQAGVFRVKATDTYFAVTANTIAVWSDGLWPHVGNHAGCAESVQSSTLVKLDSGAICELVNSTAFATTLQEAIRDQRRLAFMLIALFGWMFVISAKELRAHRFAQEMLARSDALQKINAIDTNPSGTSSPASQ